MKKLILIVFVFLISYSNLKSQDKLKEDIGKISYIGYHDDNIVVRQRETWDVYCVMEPDNPFEQKEYKLLKRGNKKFINNERTKIKYIQDDLKIKQKIIRTSNNPLRVKYKLIIKSDKHDLVLPIESLKSEFVVNEKKNLIITSGKPGRDCEGCKDAQYIAQNLAQIDLTKEEPKLKNIGLRGKYLQIVNNHLYFHQYFEGYGYGEKYNLYRVPLNK